MLHDLRPVALLLLFAAAASAQPVVTAVQDGAAYRDELARGVIFVVQGSDLSAEGFVQAPSLPLEPQLNDVSIQLAPLAGGPVVDALMINTFHRDGTNQVTALLPSSAALGEYDLAVTNNGRVSPPFRVSVVARNPGIVTADASGSGQAQATTAEFELIRFAEAEIGGFQLRPARPGGALVLWVTGIGADPLSDLDGGTSGDQTAAAELVVLVNGRAVTPLYAGRAPGLPGTDQVNLILPPDLEPGCNVTIQLRTGDRLSNLVTIAVAAPGQTACPSQAFRPEQLRALALGDSIVLGFFDFNSVISSSVFPGQPEEPALAEIIFGGFARFTAREVVREGLLLQPGQCIAFREVGRPSAITFGIIEFLPFDAGPTLIANGPNLAGVPVGRSGSGEQYIQNVTAPGADRNIVPGLHSLEGRGGVDIGPFRAEVEVPDFEWTNEAAVDRITRGEPLSVEWTGGDEGWVNIVGFGGRVIRGDMFNDPDEEVLVESGLFSCIANADAGAFTVPGDTTSQIPATTGDDPRSALTGALSVISYAGPNGASFQAPQIGGGEIPVSLGWAIGHTKAMAVR